MKNPEELAGELSFKFSESLSDLSQYERIKWVDQFIINMMDFTEQSADEHLWCELYESFKKMTKEMHGVTIGTGNL